MKLDLINLSKFYGENKVLDNVSMTLDDVKSLVLIGPSGGGKTTLLRLIAGLEPPTGGDILLDGNKIDFKIEKLLLEYRKKLSVVFQAFNLFPHLNALRNITLPLEKVYNFSKKDAIDQAMTLLKRFNLEDHAHKKPAALSGGQKQRIAICRAVALKPELLLLDEPTSALDPEYTAEVLELIDEIRNEGIRILLVTHHMGFARTVADNVLFIANGGIVERGSPEFIFDNNPNKILQKFFAKILKYG